jgi:hypothetical protein
MNGFYSELKVRSGKWDISLVLFSFSTVAKPARQFGHAMQIFPCS